MSFLSAVMPPEIAEIIWYRLKPGMGRDGY